MSASIANVFHRVGQNPVLPVTKAPTTSVVVPMVQETDEEIDARIRERFDILQLLTESTINGSNRALIVSGPAGLGKSFTVEKTLEANYGSPDNGDYTIVKGFIRATGLYRILHTYRNEGNVIVFDDADNILNDEISLNLLKAACDTTERRFLSWRAETNMKDENGDTLETNFEFNGSIIFISNINFDRSIENNSKLSPHLAAMISRANYVDLTMNTKRDHIIRIKQVVKSGMFDNVLTKAQTDDVLNYIFDNQDSMRELSLRMAIKVANIMKDNPGDWRRICNVTCRKPK